MITQYDNLYDDYAQPRQRISVYWEVFDEIFRPDVILMVLSFGIFIDYADKWFANKIVSSALQLLGIMFITKFIDVSSMKYN